MITSLRKNILKERKIIILISLLLFVLLIQTISFGAVSGTIDLNTCTITVTTDYTYTGSPINATYTIKDPGNNNRDLVLNTDFTVEYTNNIEASTDARIIFTGAGDYQGRVTKVFTINSKPLTNEMFELTTTSYDYDGNSKEAPYIAKDNDRSTNLVLGEDYTLEYSNNQNAGTATATFKGIQNYSGTITKNYTINTILLTVTPTSGQEKIAGSKDPIFSFSYEGNLSTETPLFSGQLSRDEGNASDTPYYIRKGSLKMELNGKFNPNNYHMVVDETIPFYIREFNSLRMTFTMPNDNLTLVMPIPANPLNDYEISWGDLTESTLGTTSGFPSHTYASAGTYTVRVRGHVEVFGFIHDAEVTTNGTYKDFYTFCNDLTTIETFGNIEATRLGFSRCVNLVGPIPEQSGFQNLTSIENMFNGCVSLDQEIPIGLFANLPRIRSAKNTFKNCSSLTGNLSDTLFAGCIRMKSFEATFYGCTSITGTIPENMFKDNTEINTVNQTFYGMINISGTIPEKLFANNTIIHSFSQTFANCGKISAISEKLFANNVLGTNFYRTFYNCDSITVVPIKLFADNRIHELSNSQTILDDYNGTFEDCDGIGYLEFDSYLIGFNMFKNCKNLTEVVLTKVAEIGSEAFIDSNSLQWIKVSKDALKKIGTDSFKYTNTNPAKIKTYINKDNEVLLDYSWEENNRFLDITPPKGKVTIIAPKYPYTKTEEVTLKIELVDDTSPSEVQIAVLNDVMFKRESAGTIVNYQKEIDNLKDRIILTGNSDPQVVTQLQNSIAELEDKIHMIEIGEMPADSLSWEPFNANKEWRLSSVDGIKTVYVYFKDEMGNISNYIQEF